MSHFALTSEKQDGIGSASAGQADCLHILPHKALWFPYLQSKVTGVVASKQLTAQLTFRLLVYDDNPQGEGVGRYRMGHNVVSAQVRRGVAQGMFTMCLFLDFIVVYQGLGNNPPLAHDVESEASHK